MSDPFVAEIRMFGCNFAPRGWAFCDGRLLPIAQNTALFSLIGTTYGGDGRTTTALPNLQGRLPMHPGRGPGLTSRRLGEQTGANTVTLTINEMPNHSHDLKASSEDGGTNSPSNNAPGVGSEIYSDQTPNGTLNSASLSPQGGGQSHENRQPFQALNFCIALMGVYPSRS